MLESLINKVASLYLEETPAQVFSCEICRTFKNFFYRIPQVAASVSVSFG